MEFIDFTKAVDRYGRADLDYISERAGFLREHDAIDEDVFGSLNLDRIAAFFESNLGRRAAEAAERGTLVREKPFTLRTVRNGRGMLVQGIIDCCFEEEGGMILADYKSNFIRPDRPHEAEHARIKEEYKIQIELYREAVEKGMGMKVNEAYLYLFTTGETIDMMK